MKGALRSVLYRGCTSSVFRTFSSLLGWLFSSSFYLMHVPFCIIDQSSSLFVECVSMVLSGDDCIVVQP